EHVGFLDAREAVDRRSVEGHAVFECVLELGGADREALQVAEHVGEPEAHQADAAFFDGSQHVVALLVEHLAHLTSLVVVEVRGKLDGRPITPTATGAPLPGPPFAGSDGGRRPAGSLLLGDLRGRLLGGLAAVAAHDLGQEARHGVGVAVGVRATIFGVALLVDGDLPRDADRGATVGDAIAELVPRGGLVGAREAVPDAVSVVLDEVGVRPDGLAGCDDRVVAVAPLAAGEVGVAPSIVTVALLLLGGYASPSYY